jgi:hypothetical protein
MADESAIAAVAMPLLDVDAIEGADPSALVALRQFEGRWAAGKATRRDFLDLVKLLHRIGCSTDAEYLLRINLLVASEEDESLSEEKDRLALYMELFGAAKQEEFAAAISAFSKQFSAKLTNGAGSTFLAGFHTVPRSACLKKYRLRNEQCYIRFEYEKKDFVEGQLESVKPDSDQLVFLRWVGVVWEIVGTGYCTVVDEGE